MRTAQATGSASGTSSTALYFTPSRGSLVPRHDADFPSLPERHDDARARRADALRRRVGEGAEERERERDIDEHAVGSRE